MQNSVSNLFTDEYHLHGDILDSVEYFKTGYHVGLYFDRLVIGAYQDREGKIGSIYIYQQKEAGAWELEGEKIAPPDDNKIENFGMAVSINGNRIAVGDGAYGGDDTSRYQY